MLYETLAQPKVFLALAGIGFISGLIFDFLALLNCFFKNNKIAKQILLFLGICSVFAIFSELNLLINFGDVRFFSFLSFFGLLIIERATLGKIFANFTQKCYNLVITFWKKVAKKFNERKKQKNP